MFQNTKEPEVVATQHVENSAIAQQHEHEITSNDQEPQKATLRRWVAIVSLGCLYNFALGPFLVIVSVIGVINDDIGPNSDYTWMASSWTIAAGTGIVVTGTLSDLIGRRWFSIVAGIVGALGGLVGGLAKDVPTVIVAMVLLGLGEAGGLNSLPAVAELVPTKHRGPVLGVMNAFLAVWVAAGSLIGHAMSIHSAQGWRSIFWLTLALNAATTMFLFFSYYPAAPLGKFRTSKQELLRDFDWIGLVGLLLGPTLFLMGIIWVPTYGAKSAHFLSPFLVGCATLVFLGIYEAFYAKNPLLHPHLFRRIRTFTLILVVAFVGGMLFYSLSAFLPTYLQLIYDGTDAIAIGVDGIPFGIATNVGGVGAAVLLPYLAPRIGTAWYLAFGVIAQLIFIPLMCLPGIHGKGMALTFSALGGLGIGWVELLNILLIQLATPDEWIGFSTGLSGLARTSGGSAGTAIYLTIFQNKAAAFVPSRVSVAAIGAGLPESSLPELLGVLTGVVKNIPITEVPGITPAIIDVSVAALKNAYISSFKYVWLTSISFGVIALGCALSTKDLSSHLTLKVAQHIQAEAPVNDEETVKHTSPDNSEKNQTEHKEANLGNGNLDGNSTSA